MKNDLQGAQKILKPRRQEINVYIETQKKNRTHYFKELHHDEDRTENIKDQKVIQNTIEISQQPETVEAIR